MGLRIRAVQSFAALLSMAWQPSSAQDLPVYAPPLGLSGAAADDPEDTTFRTDWSRYYGAILAIVARDLGLSADAVDLVPAMREDAIGDYDAVVLTRHDSNERLASVRMTAFLHEPGVITMTVSFEPAAASLSRCLPLLRGPIAPGQHAERRVDVKLGVGGESYELVAVGSGSPADVDMALMPEALRERLVASGDVVDRARMRGLSGGLARHDGVGRDGLEISAAAR